MSRPLSRRLRWGYAAGSVTTGAFGTVPGLMLLPFLTDSVGVAAGLAAVVVLVPKLWDVVLNPWAGRASDRNVDPRGPRRPYLLRFGLLLAVGFPLIFAGPPLGSRSLDVAWVLVAYLACATAYAFFQIPYIAMPAELTTSYSERIRLMTVRVAVFSAAILVSGAAAPAIRNAVGGPNGYRLMGVVIALLIAAGSIVVYVGTRGAALTRIPSAEGSLRDQFAVVAGDREFRALVTVLVLQGFGTGVLLAGTDYMARWVFEDRRLTSLMFVCFLGAAILVAPIWDRVGRKVGKKRGFAISTALFGLGPLLILAAPVLPELAFVGLVVSGVGYAGAEIFPLAMLPDVAALDAARSGRNRAGVYTGTWTSAGTLGFALGPPLFGVMLAIGGYRESTGELVAQPQSALTTILVGYTVVPAILVLLSVLWLRRYTIDSTKVEQAQRVLTRIGENPA